MILFLLNAKRSEVCISDFIFAITFLLSTSSIEMISVFCLSRNSSIFFRKGLGLVRFADSLLR